MYPRISLVIIPHWLVKVLESHGLTMSHALDIVSLSRILCHDDVGFYVAINRYLFDKIHKSLRETFTCFDLTNAKSSVLPDADGFYPSDADVSRITQIVSDKLWNQFATPDRMPDAEHLLDVMPHNESTSGLANPIDVEQQLNFTVFSIKDDVFGITFSPKETNISPLVQTIQSYDAVLSLLSGLYGFEATAQLPLFNAYSLACRYITA